MFTKFRFIPYIICLIICIISIFLLRNDLSSNSSNSLEFHQNEHHEKVSRSSNHKQVYPNIKNCEIKNGSDIYQFGYENYTMTVKITLDIQKFFNDHDIWSVAIGGSLLGAVRHQTQIPWDNDVDFAINLKDTRKLLSLNDELISKGYRVYSMYRLIKIRAIKIIPCTDEIINMTNTKILESNDSNIIGYHYFKKENITICMNDISGTWVDIFVISHICANLYINNTGDYFNPIVRCKCYMFDNSNTTVRTGLSHGRNAILQGVHNSPTDRSHVSNLDDNLGVPMPGICGDIDNITKQVVEYYPERSLYKYDKGEIWGQKEYNTALTLKYGQHWNYFISNVGKHLSRNKNNTACRHYDLEKNSTT
jgi:hypothetical protein